MSAYATCTVPFRFGRRHGDRWTCPDCGMEWDIRSNQYDSLLPFGDYTWFSNPEPRGGFWSKVFGAMGSRALQLQPEPSEHDRRRLGELLHLSDALGISHQLVLDVYDRNRSAHLPYHGAAHGVTVALRATQHARDIGLPQSEQRAILLAGLYHDADYVIGDPEPQNISRAVLFTASSRADTLLEHRAARLIRATMFPHSLPADDAEAVLQDADLLQRLEPDAPRFLAGLEQETGKRADPAFPPSSMLTTTYARERVGRTAN